jgi:CheY-like chemotaxis protein
VESKTGQGTTFHLYFPAVEGPATETLHSSTTLRHGSGQHILFVDDEPGLAQLGTSLLQRLGYAVTAFTNPEDAVNAFQKSPEKFALAITDFAMPKMTGGELARRLLEVRPGTPIILTTGYSATIDLEKARQLGFRDLVSKPFSLQAFSETVYRVLGETEPKAG